MNYNHWNLIVLLIFCLMAFIIYRIYSQKIIVKKEMNSSKILEQQEFTFKFYEKNLTINTDEGIEKFKYINIWKAFETNKYFYLYIDKTHAFILDKKGFINYNNNKFRKFLKSKLNRKFKI